MGRLDVDGLLQELSSAQLTEWQAFERLEPFGHPAMNWFFGVISTLIANIFRNREVRKTPFSAKDFEYDYAEELLHPPVKEELTQNELENKLMMAMSAFGAVIPE